MTAVVIFGGSGYAGTHIVEAAAVRGLDVTSVTRTEAAEQIGGARYHLGSLLDPADRARELARADVVLVAVSPRGDMAGRVRGAVAELAAEAESAGVRLGVIGGSGSLTVARGGRRRYELPEFADEARAEAIEMGAVLDDLRAHTGPLDWFYVSPAGDFGPHNAGEYTGEYRIGGDELLVDENGVSTISGADFGVAVVDEIEDPEHPRSRFTIGY